jgi:hypothetical protein
MHKQFLLVFIIIFNLSMYSQIVIKDEIVFDETITDEAGLTMPFYGTVGEVIFQNTIVCSNTKTFLIVDLTEYPFGPCQGLTCGQYINCFCSAGNPFRNIYNVPMGTTINTKFLKCIQINGEWVEYELEYYFQLILPNDAGISYQIFARLNESSPWVVVGRMNFTHSDPPGCYSCSEVSDDACDECIDNNNLLPDINLVQVENGYGGVNVCSDPDNAGGFNIIADDGLENINFILNACFNSQLDRWWFSIVGNELRFRYILDFCSEDIQKKGGTLIENYQDFPSDYGCDNILRDLNNHYDYPVQIAKGGFVLKSIIEGHELEHYLDFVIALQVEKEVLFQELLDVAPLCEDFNSVETATTYWRVNRFGKLLYDFWDRVCDERDKHSKAPGYEDRTQSKIIHTIDQIKKDALCYWNCDEELKIDLDCP